MPSAHPHTLLAIVVVGVVIVVVELHVLWLKHRFVDVVMENKEAESA